MEALMYVVQSYIIDIINGIFILDPNDRLSLGEISDLALFKVRPMFSTLPGVSAPPPFGGAGAVAGCCSPSSLSLYTPFF